MSRAGLEEVRVSGEELAASLFGRPHALVFRFLARFEAFFPAIKSQATDDRNYVKKAVSWALRQIGKRQRGVASSENCQNGEGTIDSSDSTDECETVERPGPAITPHRSLTAFRP